MWKKNCPVKSLLEGQGHAKAAEVNTGASTVELRVPAGQAWALSGVHGKAVQVSLPVQTEWGAQVGAPWAGQPEPRSKCELAALGQCNLYAAAGTPAAQR